jgi:hypothetical protein
VAKMPIDAVVHNGDVIDGHQHRQKATELCLPMVGDQAEAAAKALWNLKKKLNDCPWYFIQGTEYHETEAARELEAVAKDLGGVSYMGLGTGKYSRDCLDLDVDGVVIDFSHHISTGGGIYRASPADREGIWSALAGKEGKAPKADAVVRSHIHYYTHVEHASKHIIITPCWQLQTRFMRKLSRYKMIPDIGAVIITVDADAKRDGLDPIHVNKILYPLPDMKPTKLEK